MKYSVITSTFILLVSTNVIADKNKFSEYELICKPKSIIGFFYDKNKKDWVSTTFTAKHKYTVLKSDIDGIAYTVKDFKTNEFKYSCKKEIDVNGYLNCGFPSISGRQKKEFKINIVSGRYITGKQDGYYNIFPLARRKEITKNIIKANQEREKNNEPTFDNYEPPSDETSDTPFIEIGTCEKL
jgi:hypothetical protein